MLGTSVYGGRGGGFWAQASQTDGGTQQTAEDLPFDILSQEFTHKGCNTTTALENLQNAFASRVHASSATQELFASTNRCEVVEMYRNQGEFSRTVETLSYLYQLLDQAYEERTVSPASFRRSNTGRQLHSEPLRSATEPRHACLSTNYNRYQVILPPLTTTPSAAFTT